MTAIIKLFWDMCWLRANPQDTPYSFELFLFTLLLNALTSMAQLLFQQTFLQALWQTSLMLSLTLLFTVIVLRVKNHTLRFLQTATALLGTETIISILVFPLLLFQFYVLRPADENVFAVLMSILFLMAIIFFNIWILIVTTNIFRHALEVPIIGAAFVTAAFVGIHVLVYLFWIV